MAMRKLNDTWRIPHTIYKNMPGHSLLRSSRIAITYIMDGGLRRTPTYNHPTVVAEYSIRVHGLNLGRRMALFGPGTLLRMGRDQIHRMADRKSTRLNSSH